MTAPSLPMQPDLRKQSRNALVNHLLCGFLSMVFLAAAVAKTMSFRELEATLAASKLVPVLLTRQAGMLLIVTEYLVSLLLIFPKTRQPTLNVAATLCSVFIAYSTWRWQQGISVPCTCFGALFRLEPWQSILLNTGLLIAICASITTPTTFQWANINRKETNNDTQASSTFGAF